MALFSLFPRSKKQFEQPKAQKRRGPMGSLWFIWSIWNPKPSAIWKIFNISISTCTLPSIWKQSTIIPLLKPGKPVNDSKSHRPISLLCPASKILEKCLLPTIQKHLKCKQHQHGFRRNHSTISALNEISAAITDGFNKKPPAERTLLVALDLSKAFDLVSHNTLLAEVNRSSLPRYVTRWLACYLHGRQARTMFRDSLSKSRNVRFGVPQGSVLGPILFNFYVSGAPLPPAHINLVSYADDFTVYAKSNNVDSLATEISAYVEQLCEFLQQRQMEVSLEKCSSTLFTPWTKQYKCKPAVKVNSTILEVKNNPKILGLTFDNGLTWGPHCSLSCQKAAKRVNTLTALSGTTWGQQKETLLNSYKAFVQLVLEYACRVWTPAAAPSTIEKLQKVQNAALRVATGCTTMSSIQHLHDECKILPIRRHIRMKSVQQQLTHHIPNHPGSRLRKRTLARTKQSLHSRYQRYIEALRDPDSDDEISSRERYKSMMQSIHTNEVKDYMDTREDNKILNSPAPEISADEEKLPRKTRRILAQLRSGYSPHLRAYLKRTGVEDSDLCPDCKKEKHTTNHLFDCEANPTNLCVLSLWESPTEAANFLPLQDDDSTEAASWAKAINNNNQHLTCHTKKWAIFSFSAYIYL